MTRRRWVVDVWDPESDPGLLNMRDALARREPQPAPTPEPAGYSAPVSEPEPIEEPVEAPAPKRDRIADLVARVRSGDLSTIDVLRRALDR